MFRRVSILSLIALMSLFLSACSNGEAGKNAGADDQKEKGEGEPTTSEAPGETPAKADSGEIRAIIETSKGTIRLRLFADQTPVTCANFINLTRRGYYDGLKFWRVEPNFMIQGGCPRGDGRGGPGYKFEDEIVPELRHSKPGILSMANGGPRTNGSQFFITHVPTPHLDGKHTVFGEVIDETDQAVVNRVVKGDTINAIVIEGDVSSLMEKQQERVAQWNTTLDQKFPKLRKAE